MDLAKLVTDKPVLTIGSAFSIVSALAVGAWNAGGWVWQEFAHAGTVKEEIAAKTLELKAEMDRHARDDKAAEAAQARRDAWLAAGQAKTDATMARNRTNDCAIRPPKTPLEMTACEQYRQDMVDANLRYQRAQEVAQRTSRP